MSYSLLSIFLLVLPVILVGMQFIFGFILISKGTKSRVRKLSVYAVSAFVLELIIFFSMGPSGYGFGWVDTVLNWISDLSGGTPLDTLAVVTPISIIVMCWLLLIDKVCKLSIVHNKGILKASVIMFIQGILSAGIMGFLSVILFCDLSP